MLLKAPVIKNAHIRVSSLPYLSAKLEFLFGAKGKAAFDQLHCLLNAHFARDGHQDVDVIGHDHEVVYGQLPGAHIGSKNFDKECRHAICLEERSSVRCPSSDKERARVK
jgi:hypothetical protein